MKMRAKNLFRLGFFVTAGVAIFIFAIYYIGIQENIFKNMFNIYCIFDDVSGLKVGDDVNYSGIEVGTVNNITIYNDTLIKVELTIEEDSRKFIRKNATVEIRSEGLIGSKDIHINPGTVNSPVVEDGDFLETIKMINIEDIIKDVKKSSEQTILITKNIAEISDKINRGEGIFGKVFTDTSFTNNLDRISLHTAVLTNNVSDITRKINQEKGVIGKLLSDTAYERQFDVTLLKIAQASTNIDKAATDLTDVSTNLLDVSKRLKSEKGIFGKIFTDTTFLDNLYEASNNTRVLADNLANVSEKLNTGNSVAYKLFSDSSFADSFEVTIKNLNKAIENINRTTLHLQNKWYIRSRKVEKMEGKKD